MNILKLFTGGIVPAQELITLLPFGKAAWFITANASGTAAVKVPMNTPLDQPVVTTFALLDKALTSSGAGPGDITVKGTNIIVKGNGSKYSIPIVKDDPLPMPSVPDIELVDISGITDTIKILSKLPSEPGAEHLDVIQCSTTHGYIGSHHLFVKHRLEQDISGDIAVSRTGMKVLKQLSGPISISPADSEETVIISEDTIIRYNKNSVPPRPYAMIQAACDKEIEPLVEGNINIGDLYDAIHVSDTFGCVVKQGVITTMPGVNLAVDYNHNFPVCNDEVVWPITGMKIVKSMYFGEVRISSNKALTKISAGDDTILFSNISL